MSREDKMQLDEGGAGRVAGRVFAFVGVTLACAVIAVLAAVFIITKGPSSPRRGGVRAARGQRAFLPGGAFQSQRTGSDHSRAGSDAPVQSAEPVESVAPAESAAPAEERRASRERRAG
ncbi:MAG: hypothetical protein ACLTSG_12520 [Lachnospiraceae bacterium]